MLDSLLTYSDHPMWLFFVVVISTFVLEDLAIIGVALLAATERIHPAVGFSALCVGMFVGDTALYFLGRAAHRWPWLGNKFQHPIIKRQVTPLQRAPWHQLVLIRCMPGLRTFGYIACGLARVPTLPFTLANLLSILIWAAVLFYLTYSLGQRYAESIQEWIWWVMPVALLIFVLGQRKLRQKMEQEQAS